MLQKLTKTLVGTMAVLCVVSTLALAEEMTCSQDDGKNCLMAKDADNQEVKVMVLGAKVGDKLVCVEKDDGTVVCRPAVMMQK